MVSSLFSTLEFLLFLYFRRVEQSFFSNTVEDFGLYGQTTREMARFYRYCPSDAQVNIRRREK